MKLSQLRCLRFLLAILIAVSLAACSSAPYRHEPFENFNIEQRAVTQESGAFKIRASVPGDEEAERLFGIPLTKRDIQAVWLEVTNTGDTRGRFAPYSIDDQYFPPHEVAYMYRKQFSKQGWLDMEKRFHELSMPRYLGAGDTASGFVFTNAHLGTKSFNVDIFYTDGRSDYEQFTFFIDVPGFTPDHAEVDFQGLYAPEEIRDIDVDTFRSEVAEMPCCTTNSDGSGKGQPIVMLLVAEGRDLLQALLRSGWGETSYERNDSYLNATDYYVGRPPDAIFRKGRDKSTERNEMGIWLSPIRVDGVPVWVAQIKHAIGRRYEIGEQFLGVRLDPDINDGRNYLLQDLWYSQALKHYAWSDSGERIPMDSPKLDFNDNAWFSDGYRVVVWLSGDPVSLDEVSEIKWDTVADVRSVP
jgi:hypothetical protein